MRVRWRYLLPIVGLLLFAAVTYSSLPVNRGFARKSRFFFWSAIRLDSDPQNKRSSTPCKAEIEGCDGWELVSISVDPGWLGRTLIISALPAFLLEEIILSGVGRMGISQVSTFMVSMPLLIAAWYYLAGNLVDRLMNRLAKGSFRLKRLVGEKS